MRMIVFFDLPTETTENKRAYRKFRKLLISNGFTMMQESVYCKLLLNTSAEDLIFQKLMKEKPTDGIVQVLTITEKQFAKIKCITGERHSEVLDSDERTVIL